MINIVMTVRNRYENTIRCIESLVGTNGDWTLTIVDDCSTDTRLLDYLACLPSDFHIIHNTENLGVGGSKNRGVAESEARFGRGDYLYLSDNDVIFTDGWMDKLVEAYEFAYQGKFLLIGGYSHPYNGTNAEYHFGKMSIHEKNAVDGLSWLLTWDTWDKYGKLMDNARGVRQSEDWEYCQRIRNDGYRVGVVYPHVVINNGVVDTFGERIPGAEQVEAIEKARMS